MLAFVLDAVMGPMCAFELSAEATTALTSLCEHLAAFQPSHVVLVPSVGKVLESLGPVLLVVPGQAQRVVEAFFGLIDRMHTLQVSMHMLQLLRTTSLCSTSFSVSGLSFFSVARRWHLVCCICQCQESPRLS